MVGGRYDTIVVIRKSKALKELLGMTYLGEVFVKAITELRTFATAPCPQGSIVVGGGPVHVGLYQSFCESLALPRIELYYNRM